MMECNRDEALRAREIAEKKLVLQDYHGALKFLQKALQLFPALENTSQMSAVIDVHIAAQSKINGMETDWYGILQVDPCAEDILIKKQYKKLALLLHPDKNKFAGAEAAFKLIGEALQVLSDKQQRSLHDSRRKPVGRGNSATQRSQSRQTSGYPYANRQAATSSTFITVCPSCHTRYQYYRVYENQNLLCHQCRIPFLAREFHTGQSNGAYNAYGWQHFTQQQQGFDHGSFQPFSAASNFTSGVKVQASHTVDPIHSGASKPGEPGGVPAEHANQMFREKSSVEEAAQGIKRKRRGEKEAEKVMRRLEREQQKKAKADLRAQEAMERLMNKRKKQAEKASAKDKKRRLKKHLSDSSDDDEDESHSLDDLSDDQVLNHAFDSKAVPRRSSRPRRNVTYKVDVSDDDDDPSQVTQAQVTKEDDETLKETGKATDGKEKDAQNGDSADMKEKQKLADFFKIRIRLNLNLQGARPFASVNDDSGNPGKAKRVKGERCKAGETSRQDHSVPEEEESEGKKDSKEESESGEDSKEEEFDDETDDQVKEEPGKYSVPDPDFHDFDNDREEKDVAAGQIWAGYDDIEGLPRYYFRVKEVQSQTPFKVSISWLELRNMTEEQQTLKELGFSPTWGNCFRNSSTQVLDTVDMFSHILKWEKGVKGTIKIYPRKGDVWALYSDWEPGLGFKKRCLSRKYDMVEVLTDFSEQTGVSVTRLDKLPEYKTLFKGTEACLAIPAAELCRFSYQVPAYKLQGNEAPGIQKGCWELDPASVPIDLIFPGSNADKLR